LAVVAGFALIVGNVSNFRWLAAHSGGVCSMYIGSNFRDQSRSFHSLSMFVECFSVGLERCAW
jgi:hypothetical protein